MQRNTAHALCRALRHSAVVLAAAVPCLPTAAEERVGIDAWGGAGGSGAWNSGVVATYAPTGSLYGSGLRVIGGASTGRYEYLSVASPSGTVAGRYTEFFAQLGYNFAGPRGSLTIAAGPTVSKTELSFVPAGDSEPGVKVGLRAGLTGFMPVGSSGFFLGVVSHSFADTSTYYLARLGFNVRNGLAFGPETSLASGRNYREERLGVHLTGIPAGKLNFGLAAGARSDQDNRRGGYFQVSGRLTF